VPEGFLFCPKLSRYITHMKKLKEPEEPLERFFDVFAPMQPHMGPVLVQLPPSLKWDYDRAEHLYGVLKKLYKQYEFVLEVRHATWLEEDSLTLMAQYEVGLVISQSAGVFPYSEMVTAKNVYLRFHGPAALYASPYSDADLQYFAGKIRNWIAEGTCGVGLFQQRYSWPCLSRCGPPESPAGAIKKEQRTLQARCSFFVLHHIILFLIVVIVQQQIIVVQVVFIYIRII
jgi:uncharacterized protein YecE (DUF72 family)